MHKNPRYKNVDLNHLTRQRLYHGVAILNPEFTKRNNIKLSTNQLYIWPETHQSIPLKAQINRLHTWDYAFWLDYLDLQRQALGLKPKFAELDDQADDHHHEIAMQILKDIPEKERPKYYREAFTKAYKPIINQIIKFWQEYPNTIYGSQVYLHGMAKTFFRNKVSYEEPQQGRQIKATLKALQSRNWDAVADKLLDYKGWWN